MLGAVNISRNELIVIAGLKIRSFGNKPPVILTVNHSVIN